MDTVSKEQRSLNMSRIRSIDTAPELIVRSFLHAKGFRFRLYHKDLPGKPDIVLKKYKTVIFVNGCFWHSHKGCKYSIIPKTNKEYWVRKLERTKTRDMENIDRLTSIGWRVIIVWECKTKSLEDLSELLSDLLYNREIIT